MSLSPIGWLHTLLGIIAIGCGLYLLAKDHEINAQSRVGKIYIIATLITGASALTIFNHGGFNTAHGLAVLTIAALVVGLILEKTKLFKSWNKYFVNLSYSSTLLFHFIPAATEVLTRFPMEAPAVSSFEDPLLHKTFLSIFAIFVVVILLQMNWLRKQN